MSRLKRLKQENTSTTLYDDQFTYNTANQISQIAGLSQTRNFTYDNINRLTGVAVGGSTVESYTYDSVGNRTASHLSSSYTTGSFNRVTATDSATYTYNNNGSTTGKTVGSTTWAYGWDRENRMVSAGDGTNTPAYAYDALGRRVKRTQGSDVQKYTHDGPDVVLDDINSTLTKYQNGPGIDNKQKFVTGGTSKYFLQDHLGSSVAIANSSASAIDSNGYDSFGNVTNGSFTSRYQYTGRESDPLSGLSFYRARFYDSNLGRFGSEDPIGFKAGDINLYGYVNNRPLLYRDPLGLTGTTVWASPDFWRAVAAAFAAVGAVASSPAVVAGAGFGAGYAIGYYPGQWTANHPSNPFVRGPWNPFGNPYPASPRVPPSIVRPPTGTVCQVRPRAIPWTRSPSIPFDDDPNDDDPDDRGCDRQLQEDQAVCGRITNSQMQGACYAHAFDRWASCKAGRNIPYNPWPFYPWD